MVLETEFFDSLGIQLLGKAVIVSDMVADPSFSPQPVFQQVMGREDDVAEPSGKGASCGPCLCQGAQPLPWLLKHCPGQGGSSDPNFLCHD